MQQNQEVRHDLADLKIIPVWGHPCQARLRWEKPVPWGYVCVHGCYSHIQKKCLPAHSGYNFISRFPATTDSFHRCTYIQIFYPSDLKLRSDRIRETRPVLGTAQGLQFHPRMGLLLLNPAFVLGAPMGTQPQSLNHPLVSVPDSTQCYPAPPKSTAPRAPGRKARAGAGSPRTAGSVILSPNFHFGSGGTVQACNVCHGDSL